MSILVGYNIAHVSKADAVRFVNLCAALNIKYRSLGFSDVDGEQILKIKISPYDCFRAQSACQARTIEFAVVKHRGTDRLLGRLFSRIGLWIGAALACVLFVASQRVLWDVRVVTPSSIDEGEVVSLLEKSGLSVGMSTDSIEVDKIQNRALILSDKISWIRVNVTGTVARVELIEKMAVGEPSDAPLASNLVARRGGTVVELDRVRGNVEVNVGDDVAEGQLLVGGVYSSENSAMRFSRASGTVFARCIHELDIKIPLNYRKKVYTGNKKVQKTLIFFKKEVNFLPNSRNLYASCDTIIKEEYLDFFGLGKLPVGIRTTEYVEYGVQSAVLDEQTAREQAIFEANRKFFDEAPDASLLKRRFDGEVRDGYYILSAYYEAIENIAEEKRIEVQIFK